jgi:hypothetical protein
MKFVRSRYASENRKKTPLMRHFRWSSFRICSGDIAVCLMHWQGRSLNCGRHNPHRGTVCGPLTSTIDFNLSHIMAWWESEWRTEGRQRHCHITALARLSYRSSKITWCRKKHKPTFKFRTYPDKISSQTVSSGFTKSWDGRSWMRFHA